MMENSINKLIHFQGGVFDGREVNVPFLILDTPPINFITIVSMPQGGKTCTYIVLLEDDVEFTIARVVGRDQ